MFNRQKDWRSEGTYGERESYSNGRYRVVIENGTMFNIIKL
jgi:hypothetical protein